MVDKTNRPSVRVETADYWASAVIATPPGRRMVWWSVASLLLFLLAVALAFRTISGQFTELNSQRSALVHSREVLGLVTNIRDNLQQGLTGIRLYTELGKPDFLLSYQDARSRFASDIAQFRQLVVTEAGQGAITELEQLGNRSLQYGQSIIDAYDSKRLSAAELAAMTEQNGRNVIAIRVYLEDWRKRETATLVDSERRTELQLQNVQRKTYWRFVVACLVIFVLGWLLLRYIGRRYEAERRLLIASRFWSGTLQSLNEGVGLYTNDRRLVLWNSRYAEVHGVSPEMLYSGIPFDEVIRQSTTLKHVSVADAVTEASQVADRIRHGDELCFEHERSDGMILRVTAANMGSDHYVVMLSDITSMRRSEQLARDQATRLNAVMDNVPDAIVTINASDSIESWSAGAERMFGFSSDEVLRRHVRLLLAEPYASAQDGYLQRCLNGHEPELFGKRIELEARRKNASTFPVDLTMSEMHIDGRRILVAIIRDITERRAVDRMKGEFVSTVSHELRTPLTSIAGSLALLASGAGGAMPQRAQHLLDIANRNSKRLTVLINDILELEKADVGKLNLKLLRQPLLPVLQHALEANRAYAEQYQVRFELRNGVPEPVLLLDDMRIQQVLANLLSNAVKFSPPGATVLIEVAQQSTGIRITVHDDGPGIPESFRERLFMRFAQADNTDARRSGGTGLGLSITKSLVELHGGQIGFETGRSAVGGGQGASFWFQLPVLTTEDDTLNQPLMLGILNGARIMVCDDDPDIAELLSALLQQQGCYVEVVNTAFIARDRLRQQAADLLLVDMNLPDIDGLTLVAQLRQQPQLQHMAIVILSAVDCAELDAAMLTALGVGGCLRKPVQANALITAVAWALQRGQD